MTDTTELRLIDQTEKYFYFEVIHNHVYQGVGLMMKKEFDDKLSERIRAIGEKQHE